jgi:hypothetical protein
LLNNGQLARGGGWVDRAQRLLDKRKLKCVEHGYLGYAAALRSVFSGDVEVARAGFSQAARIGERFRNPEITTLARIGEGRCLVYLGEVAKGVALLDEAMVAVGAGEVSPIATGDAYCTVIEGCQETFDVRRAYEWTAALSQWCESQPELVLYRGQCLLHRAELMLLRGGWTDALDEAERACGRLADGVGHPALGAASYLRGELHRLRGELTEAEHSYRTANDVGRDRNRASRCCAWLRVVSTVPRRQSTACGTRPKTRSRERGSSARTWRSRWPRVTSPGREQLPTSW